MNLRTTRIILWVPLILFFGFALVVAGGLIRTSSSTIRSRLIGQPLPDFALPPALPGRPSVSRAAFVGGKPRLLNVFASWCVPCAAESPIAT